MRCYMYLWICGNLCYRKSDSVVNELKFKCYLKKNSPWKLNLYKYNVLHIGTWAN